MQRLEKTVEVCSRGRQSLRTGALGLMSACVASWIAVVALGLWRVESAKAEKEDDPAHVTLRMIREPTPAWIPRPAVEIPGATAADPALMQRYTEQIVGTGVKFEMVPVPGGRFRMGSPKGEPGRADDEGPVHEVLIDPLWMEVHEVTWDEYDQWALHLDKKRRGMSRVPATNRDWTVDAIALPSEPYTSMDFGMGKAGRPAVSMTQFSAKVYCKWLSAKTGRYYRLPTEAEWEYACRAGQTTAYSFGNDAGRLGEYAWFCDNSNDKYHKVAEKKPNSRGLYDMHGNVAEWVLDQYADDAYRKRAGTVSDNPLVPATTEYDRMVRGGSWDDDAAGCRSAARRASKKAWNEHDPRRPQSIWYLTDASFVGFRVVRPFRMPTPEEAKKYEVDQQQLTRYQDYLKAQGKNQ